MMRVCSLVFLKAWGQFTRDVRRALAGETTVVWLGAFDAIGQ